MSTMRMENAKSHVSELRSHAENVGRDISELASTAGQYARKQIDPIEQFVREQPVKSLLIAAGAGAVLGLLFLGRR